MEDFGDRDEDRPVLDPEPNLNYIFPRFLEPDLNYNKIEKIPRLESINKFSKLTEKNFLLKKNHKEEISNRLIIHNISENLESREVSERIDSFILEELVRREERRETRPRIPIVERPSLPDRAPGFRSPTGFRAHEGTYVLDQKQTVNGVSVVPDGGKYTIVDFTPGGRLAMNPKKMTDSLGKGVQGVADFIAAYDAGEVQLPPVLVGYTNINMALMAQRFGFAITDDCRTETGEVDKSRRSFTVVGTVDNIRTKLDEFRSTENYQRLQKRVARSQAAK